MTPPPRPRHEAESTSRVVAPRNVGFCAHQQVRLPACSPGAHLGILRLSLGPARRPCGRPGTRCRDGSLLRLRPRSLHRFLQTQPRRGFETCPLSLCLPSSPLCGAGPLLARRARAKVSCQDRRRLAEARAHAGGGDASHRARSASAHRRLCARAWRRAHGGGVDCPSLFEPQHRILPSTRTAQPCWSPIDSCVN